MTPASTTNSTRSGHPSPSSESTVADFTSVAHFG